MAAGVVKNSDKIVKTTSKRAEFVEEAEKRSPAKKAERGSAVISLIQGISSQLSIVPAQKGGSHLYRAIVSASQSSIGKNKASAAIKQDLYTIAEDILLTSFLEVVHLFMDTSLDLSI